MKGAAAARRITARLDSTLGLADSRRAGQVGLPPRPTIRVSADRSQHR
jgi:hypothetical protein